MALFDRSDRDQPAAPRASRPEPAPAAPAAASPAQPETPRYPSSGAPRTSESALIGPGLRVEGEVHGEEDLILDGEVKGALSLGAHQLLIGEAGRAEADVVARKVVVFGELVGNIEASESIELGHTARVQGNLKAPRLRIDEGAVLNGRLEMGGRSRGADHGAKAAPAKEKSAPATPASAPEAAAPGA